MTTESPDGTTAVISLIVDDVGVVWTLSTTGAVLRNGVHKYVWAGNTLLWFGHQLYLASFTDRGYALNRTTGGAVLLSPADPIMEVLLPKPQITSFKVTPSSVSSGATVTVEWTSVNGKRAYLDSVAVAVNGSVTDKPTITRTYRLVVQGKGPDAVATTTVTVGTVQPPAPTITTSSLSSGQVGVAYSASLAASGGTPPYTWSIGSGSLPAGLTLAQSGAISGTPSSQGSFAFSVRVVDSASQSATKPLSIDVAAATATNRPPVWQTIPTLNFTLGTPSSVSVAQYASDPDGNPLTFTLETGPVPSGITFNPTNATFSYNGGGAAISVTGITVGADDGK